MPEQKGVNTYSDGQTHFSVEHPARAVKEVLFGFACYEKVGGEGVHRGITDQYGAYQWLNGEQPHQLLKVPGVTHA